MKPWTHVLVSGVLVAMLLGPTAGAQKGSPGGTTSSSSSNSSAPPAGGGGGGSNIAIESEMIAYEAIHDLAIEISSRVRPMCTAGKNQVLLALPPNVTAIGTYQAFEAAAESLAGQYQGVSTINAMVVGAAPGPTDWISAIGGFIASAKTTTTMSSATFTPTDQALYADLERELHNGCSAGDCTKARKISNSCTLWATVYPGQVAAAYGAKIIPLVQQITQQRGNALQRLAAANPQTPNYKAESDPAIQKLDTQFAALQSAITDTSSSSGLPNVLLGAALTVTLGDQYHVLSVTDDAAGGGSRANVYFLINLFIPAPHPSYNGGAVVSYSLHDDSGAYEDADTLRLVFGYGKWHEPPLRNQHDKGYANFKWDDSNNKGSWSPIY